MDSPEAKRRKSQEKKKPSIEPKLEPTASTSVAARCTDKTSTNAPDRVIKQIIALDSKELKGLGIESFILSAISKLNGSKSAETDTSTSPNQTSREEKPSQKDKTSVELHREPSTPDKSPCPSQSNKKIQVLSQVVLNEDVKQFSVNIASRPLLKGSDTLILPAQTLTIQSKEEAVAEFTDPPQYSMPKEEVNEQIESERSDLSSDFEGFPPLDESDSTFGALVKPQTNPKPKYDETQAPDDDASSIDSLDLSLSELIGIAEETIKDCESAQEAGDVESSDESSDTASEAPNNFIDDFLSATKQSFIVDGAGSDSESSHSQAPTADDTNEPSPECMPEENITELEEAPNEVISSSHSKGETY